MAHFLIAADVHGRLPLLLRLARAVQIERRIRLDGILVCGDMGVFPDPGRCDPGTLRYARACAEELGFLAFSPLRVLERPSTPRPAVREYLARARWSVRRALCSLQCCCWLVCGNREDHAYLEACRSLVPGNDVPVERTGFLRWIPSGAVVEIPSPSGALRVAGIGGIDARDRRVEPGVSHPLAIIDEAAVRRLARAARRDAVDVLLSHDSVPGFVEAGSGSPALGELVRALDPAFHFFGHYHAEREPLAYERFDRSAYRGVRTVGVHLNKLKFGRHPHAQPCSTGLLTWSPSGRARFEFLPAGWLRRLA